MSAQIYFKNSFEACFCILLSLIASQKAMFSNKNVKIISGVGPQSKKCCMGGVTHFLNQLQHDSQQQTTAIDKSTLQLPLSIISTRLSL